MQVSLARFVPITTLEYDKTALLLPADAAFLTQDVFWRCEGGVFLIRQIRLVWAIGRGVRGACPFVDRSAAKSEGGNARSPYK